MELSFTSEEREFQQEVRAFLKEKLTPDLVRSHALTPSVFSDPPVGNRWQRILYDRGWAAPIWPKEYGGTGWSIAQTLHLRGRDARSLARRRWRRWACAWSAPSS